LHVNDVRPTGPRCDDPPSLDANTFSVHDLALKGKGRTQANGKIFNLVASFPQPDILPIIDPARFPGLDPILARFDPVESVTTVLITLNMGHQGPDLAALRAWGHAMQEESRSDDGLLEFVGDLTRNHSRCAICDWDAC